jgi:hypothetical protein
MVLSVRRETDATVHALHSGQLDTVALASDLQPPTEFDRQALADIKRFVDNVSLPPDMEFPPQADAFLQAAARPALQARASKAFEDGLQQRSDVELRLGEYVGQFAETDLSPASASASSGN